MKLPFNKVAVSIAVGLVSTIVVAPAVSARVYNGQPWQECQNGYVVASKVLTVSGKKYGDIKVIRCTNGGIYTRVGSAIGKVGITATTQQLVQFGYLQERYAVAYAVMSDMVPAMPGYCYNGIGKIGGKTVSTGFCM